MTVQNNGTLTVDRPMPEEVCKKIYELFDDCPGVYVDSQSITFADTPDYCLNESSELQDLLAKNGIGLELGSRVEYYGDYEGYYVWTGSKFESMDHEDYAVYALTDEELCNIMKARGYCVCKDPGVCQKQM